MIQEFKKAWVNYADVSGRSRRREFWLFMLCNVFVVMALSMFDFLTGSLVYNLVVVDRKTGTAHKEAAHLGIFTTVYLILVTVPYVSLSVRRLHDVGRR